MMMRNPRDGINGQPPENSFQIVEERSGAICGSCTVIEERRPGLFPERPHLVRLDLDAQDECLDRLLGAALARARALCSASGEASRIYMNCAPDDEDTLALLKQYGFRDNDGLLRLRLDLPVSVSGKAPMGCVEVRDMLDDAQEQGYFLERYNEFYGEGRDFRWLSELNRRKGFGRILTVAPTGMAGEVVYWMDGENGVIGFVDTARRWRRMGVARYMLGLAARELYRLGARRVYADVRARMTVPLTALEHCGFERDALLIRQPGIDL